MGMVSHGTEGLRGPSRGPREARRREQGLKAHDGPRDREPRATGPTCQGSSPPRDTQVPLRALRHP